MGHCGRRQRAYIRVRAWVRFAVGELRWAVGRHRRQVEDGRPASCESGPCHRLQADEDEADVFERLKLNKMKVPSLN